MVFPPTEFVLMFIFQKKKKMGLNGLCREASAKLRKAIISFIFSVSLCPSVRPYGKARLPQDICRENSSFIKTGQD